MPRNSGAFQRVAQVARVCTRPTRWALWLALVGSCTVRADADDACQALDECCAHAGGGAQYADCLDAVAQGSPDECQPILDQGICEQPATNVDLDSVCVSLDLCCCHATNSELFADCLHARDGRREAACLEVFRTQCADRPLVCPDD